MISAAVLTVSDRSAAGTREDAAGPVAVAALRDAGFACESARVVSDGADSVQNALHQMLDAGIRLIITSGGTGIGPRDETPEGTARVIDRPLPGIAEELRRIGPTATPPKPATLLSRGIAGVVGAALIVNLPGSPKAVAEGMPVVLSIAQHVLDQLDGEDHR